MLPSTMKVIDHGTGGQASCMQIKEAPLPALKPGEVLIEVAYAGVNRPDVAQRSGSYPPPPGASPYMGLEVAGKIVATADGVGASAITSVHSPPVAAMPSIARRPRRAVCQFRAACR